MNAIVWQDRRTAALCDRLKAEGWEPRIRAKTGLVLDAYFSGTKLRWMLDNVDGAARAGRARRGALRHRRYLSDLAPLRRTRRTSTDYSNASRTLLFNIHTLQWDDEILSRLEIPRAMLPEPRPSSEVYAETDPAHFGAAIPIAGDAGDQQAATFGQACFEPGTAKNTYGTGSFLLMNTGERAPAFATRAADDRRLGAGRQGHLLPGGQHLHHRRGHPVAARRAGHHRPGR